MVRAELFEDVTEAEGVHAAWDGLARASKKPFCAPAWMLAWWRNAAPTRSRLRVIAVFENDHLIGVGPFFSIKTRGGLDELRFLGSKVSVRGEPLSAPGKENEVASAIVDAIDRMRPRIDLVLFEGVPTLSRWPSLLYERWRSDGSSYKHRAYPTLAPSLDLTGRSYDEWFDSRPSHFRQEIRRRRRHLEQRGGRFQMAEGAEEVVGALDAFFRLHHSRWKERGGSAVLTDRVQAMLLDAALGLVEESRFRIWTIAADGEVVSAHIFLAAGGEVAYWLGGFDESWAKLGPAIQTVLKALEHAWNVGDTRMDFGAGAQEYKYSFAESQDVLESVTIAPRNIRYPVTRMQLVPRRLREEVSTRMSAETRARLARFRRQGP
jgi:CelD/BcsL family acetyltransferase involved in cellulose biosynthesis